jgi:hypothetical protein
MRLKAILPLLAVVLLLAACNGGNEAAQEEAGAANGSENTGEQEGERTGEPTAGNEEAPETEREAANGEAGNGDNRQQGSGDRGGAAQDERLVLRVQGDEGVRFEGTCKTGEQERRIQGQTPERFAFPAEQPLECEVRKRGQNDGRLSIVLLAGEDTRFTHRTNARGGEIRFTYAGNSFRASSTGGASVSSNVQSVTEQSGGGVQESITQFGDQRNVQSQGGDN